MCCSVFDTDLPNRFTVKKEMMEPFTLNSEWEKMAQSKFVNSFFNWLPVFMIKQKSKMVYTTHCTFSIIYIIYMLLKDVTF